ncbi:MAG: CapA family protein [Parasporobacterium sp.]|nr:CapA family protein [Parasporobacterium sp.]
MKKFKPLIVVAVIVVIIAIITACIAKEENGRASKDTNKQTEETTTETTTEAAKSITLVAVGDVLNHNPVLEMANNGDGTYDFSNLFVNMKDTISKADIAVVNNETIIGGADQGIQGGSPYLIFNSPDELADNIIDAGFDLVLQASNHSDDMGSAGIRHCIELWKSKSDKIKMIGLNESQEERDTISYMEVGGIKLAVLNYTYGLNGFVLPEGQDYLVDQMTDETFEQVKADIQKADAEADFVIVFPHWGTEYVVGDATQAQIDWGQMFTEAGADLIIGTHPHVSEKIEKITASNGNEALCYYSLGNFTSNQAYLDDINAAYSQVEGMAVVKITKDANGTHIDYDGNTGVVPVVCHNDRVNGPNITAYKLSDYTADLCSIHATARQGYTFNLDWLNQTASDIFGEWIIDY